MSIEWRVLLLCSRVHLSAENIKSLKYFCSQGIHFGNLLKFATRHRTIPLVGRHLLYHCSDIIPKNTLADIKVFLKNQVLKNLMMSAELVKILQVFNKEGILAVPFKGPVLSQLVLGDASLRRFGDLDILVSKNDVSRAVFLLTKMGFVPTFRLSEKQLRCLVETDKEYPFIHSESGITVDLQWELTGGYTPVPFFLNEARERLEECFFNGIPIKTFSPEDLLVYLCIHGNQHIWEALDHVCLIAETLNTYPNLKWRKAWIIAQELQAEHIVRVGLYLTLSLYDLKFPETTLIKIYEDKKSIIIAEGVINDFQKNKDSIKYGLNRRFSLFHWKNQRGVKQVLGYGSHLLFMPTRYDWEVLPLPSWLSWLYFLFRPIRLLFLGVKTVLKLLMKQHQYN